MSSSPTTPEPRALDVEGLRRLEKKATPAKQWEAMNLGEALGWNTAKSHGPVWSGAPCPDVSSEEQAEIDTELAVRLRVDAPALLDAVEELHLTDAELDKADAIRLRGSTSQRIRAALHHRSQRLEAERAVHARTREALRDAKGLLFSPKSLRALSDFVLRHGDLDSNAVCLTSLDLRKRAEATEQFRAAQALLEGEQDAD